MLLTTLDHILELGLRLSLWIFYLYLDKLAPYIRHIEEEELWYYRYPSVTSFIPVNYLYVILITVPSTIFFIYYLLTKKESRWTVLRNHFYGISLAYAINAVFTALLKVIVGRPRPNFFLRCFPDGVGMEVQHCTGEWEGQMDGRKSFPSAHASFSFTGMTYVTCFLFHELDLSQPCFARGIVIFLTFIPTLIAMIISVSRFCDYHHHSSDVLSGIMLGSAIAIIIFQFYKDMNSEKQQKYQENIRKLQQLTTESN